MTIQEMILAALKTKFQGVEDAILNRIAEKKAVGVTDETKVNSIVEGISFSEVLTSYGNFRADGASRTSIANYAKKHNIKGGKPVEEPKPKPVETPKEEFLHGRKLSLIPIRHFVAKFQHVLLSQRILVGKVQRVPLNCHA